MVAKRKDAPKATSTLKPGPPHKLTPELLDRLCAGLRLGKWASHVAAANGISRTTITDWLSKGQADDAPAEFRALAHAREAGHARQIRRIRVAGQMGNAAAVKAETWIAERLSRGDFAARTEITGAEGGAVQIAGLAGFLASGFDEGDPGDGA